MNTSTVLSVTHPTGEYPVVVGANLLGRVRELAFIQGMMALITDENVRPLHAASLGEVASTISVPPGEQHKTLATVNEMYGRLLTDGLDRSSTIVALGGGVVGDMAGFAAATYMRGIDFVQCPTTLLAMVDASVGGKTGVDLPEGKNLVGAFKQPTAVLADVQTLYTLPPAEFAAGMAEVIKHGLIADGDLFAQIEDGDWSETAVADMPAEQLQKLVAQAIEVKRQVVQTNPFERGRRAVLNLGHTFGHAIEQVSGYRIRHGEGVAMGLVAAANLSARLGYCAPDLQQRIEQVLQNARLPFRIPASLKPEDQLTAMYSDKKKAAGQLRFILIRAIGDVFVEKGVPETAILASIRAISQ